MSLVLGALLACAVQATGPTRSTPLGDIDAYVERARQVFEVPGIAVGVVKDGRLVLAKGYGVRRLGSPDPVDADTLFGIASNTKAFTTAAISMLADEGRLTWDDPVTRHLPWFALYDPYASRELTVRDLVTHRSGLGLGAGDLTWWPPSDMTRREILRSVRQVRPAWSLRSRYAYNNVLYVAAGEVIAAVSGEGWDEFVTRRIFQPLGMARSTTSVRGLSLEGNVATPHALVAGRPTPIGLWNFDNAGAAASISSSVNDLARWVQVHLDEGAVAGSDPESRAGTARGRLFSERMAREMWSPQTVQQIVDPPAPLRPLKPNFAAYGLGWGLADYRGHKLASHTGALPGAVSRITLVPDLELGVVVLTNQETGEAFQSIVYRVLDAYLGSPETDWIAAYAEARREKLAEEHAALGRAAEQRAAGTKPSRALDAYAGTYRDPWYGDVAVALEDGRLVVRFTRTPLLTGDLEHWHYDTFVARWRERALNGDAYVTFALAPDGTVRDMELTPVSPLIDFSFDYHDLALRRVEAEARPRP